MLFSYSMDGFAKDFTYEGIIYTVISETDKTCKTKDGVYDPYNFKPGNRISGEVILPENPNGYTLIEIGGYGFPNCSSLTSIKIPETVTKINGYAFYKCTSLTTINLPSMITSVGFGVFKGCSSLAHIEIPASVTLIDDYAFEGCSLLEQIVIPESVTTIDKNAFKDCSSLTHIDIPASVISIGEDAFSGKSLEAINVAENNPCYSSIDGILYDKTQTYLIKCPEKKVECSVPNTVEYINYYSFNGCSELQSLSLPDGICFSSTQNYNSYFYNCNLRPLKFNGTYSYSGKQPEIRLSNNGYLVCLQKYVNEYRKIFSGEIVAFNNKYVFSLEPCICGVKIQVKDNVDYDETFNATDYVITVGTTNGDGKKIEVKETGEYLVDGLNSNSNYEVRIEWKDKDESNKSVLNFTTKAVTYSCSTSATKTSIEISELKISEDETFKANEVGVWYKEKYPYTDKKIILDGFFPATKYFIGLYAKGDNDSEYNWNREVTTQGWDCITKTAFISPSVAELEASYDDDGAPVSKVWWNYNGVDLAGKKVVLVSLTPSTENTATFNLRYGDEKNGKTYSWTRQFTTTALELTTLQPKCVSNTCAIVAAETNVSDLEPNVGFEWKKYDAPTSLAPTFGYGAVCDGMLEGYIKNLQSTSYYNVRAFYKDASGNYYYGEQITFDPSDFSYFEPTVKTYPVQNVSESTATLKGYVLPGTDNILVQGFQYWKNGRKNIKGSTPVESEIMIVKGTGQLMTVTLDNLEEATQYTFRVFVETEAGVTYGEEQTFTTDGLSYIEDIIGLENDVKVVGYYNIYGIRFERPQQGLNIVVYSNGCSRKVIL